MKAICAALASLLLVSAAPALAQKVKPSKDPANAGTFSDLLKRKGLPIERTGGTEFPIQRDTSSFGGATASAFQQSSEASPCTNAKQFQNAAGYVPFFTIDWGLDVTELTSSMSFTTGAVGDYQIAVSGSAQIPGGSPGASVFTGTMNYPDSLFVFCEIWNATNTVRVQGCPLLILGPVMAKQSAGWGGYGVAQAAALTRARGNLTPLTTYTLRVGIAGEGSNTAPNMQLCAWMVTVDAD